MSVRASIVGFLCLAAAHGAAAAEGGGCFRWKLSFSEVNPDSQLAAPAAGPVVVHLWYAQADAPWPMSVAEMTISWSPGFELFAFTARNGFLNVGSPDHLLLAVESCPWGPVVAGSFSFFDAEGTGLWACLTDPEGGDGPVQVVDCAFPVHVPGVPGHVGPHQGALPLEHEAVRPLPEPDRPRPARVPRGA